MRSLVALLLLVALAHAQPNSTQQYRVKPKESLEMIAAEYYGDRNLATILVVENKLKDRKVRAGERLRIPVTREIATDKGETFESLAEAYLGDKRRGPVLADYNEHKADDIPAIGTVLTIPAQVTHTAQNDDTLAHVATIYFGDSKPDTVELLKRYNGLDKKTLDKGESIVVPLLDVRVRKALPLDAEAKARRDEHRKLDTDGSAALELARAAWLQADFDGVRKRLQPFAAKLDYLETPLAVELGLLLGRAHVAFDETDQAVKAFQQVLARKKTQLLSPYAESPKVIDAWKRAGGQLQP